MSNILESILDLAKSVAVVIGIAALGICGMIALIVTFGLLLMNLVSIPTCNRYAELNPDYKFNYSFYGGCMVQIKSGQYVPVDQWVAVIKDETK